MSNNNLKFLQDFINLIKTPDGAISTRQYFIVSFSSAGVSLPDNLSLYVQNFDLPNLQIDNDEGKVIKNPRGTTNIPGEGFLVPESNTFDISFLETEIPIIEQYMVPWMKKCVSIKNSGMHYPFPRAKIYVDILSHDTQDILYTYEFEGCYPLVVTFPTLGQTPQSEITRTVTFGFNKSDITWNESRTHQKTASILNDIFNIEKVKNDIPFESQRERLLNKKSINNVKSFEIPGKPHITREPFDFHKEEGNMHSRVSRSFSEKRNKKFKGRF